MEVLSDRLQLVKLELNHVKDFYKYRSDAETNKYQGWIPYALEDCSHFIKNKIATQINTPNTWYQLAILKNDTSELIGDVGIHFLEDEHQVEIGCTLNKEHHGMGYAQEALTGVISFLFNDLNKHRITASVDPDNLASIKMVKKLGFRKEAHFKESLNIDGTWVDDVIFAILNREWKARTI